MTIDNYFLCVCLFLLSTAMGMGLCVAFIAFVRLPSLKVSTLLLTGLLVYDVFWVFFSSYIFNANVMVKVIARLKLFLNDRFHCFERSRIDKEIMILCFVFLLVMTLRVQFK